MGGADSQFGAIEVLIREGDLSFIGIHAMVRLLKAVSFVWVGDIAVGLTCLLQLGY